MTMRMQPYIDIFMKIPETFKIKGAKTKPLQQEQLRVAFFAGYHERKETFKIDGVVYKFNENEINVDGSGASINYMGILRDIIGY